MKVQLEVGLEEALRVLLGAALKLDHEPEVEGRTLVGVLVRFG